MQIIRDFFIGIYPSGGRFSIVFSYFTAENNDFLTINHHDNMTRSIFLPVVFFLVTCPVFAQTPSFSWVKPVFGATQTAPLNAVVSDLDADPAGNTYVTGEFQGQLNFGLGISLSGTGSNPTLFLAKYASDGTILWARKGDPVMPDNSFVFHKSSKIAVDAAGNVYWCADYQADAVNFGSGVTVTRTCTNDCEEGFLLKLNTNGDVVFQKAIRGAVGEQVHLAGIAVDSAGRHYLAGSYSGNEIWLQGGANLGGLTTQGYFLCAYNVAGGAEWIAFQTDASATPFVESIAVSPDGERIALAGTYNAFFLDFSNGATTSSNAVEKRFVAWYNTTGQPQGAGTLAAGQSMLLFDLELDDQYRAWVVGNYAGALEWNGEALAPAPALPSAGMVAVVAPGTAATLPVSIEHTPLSVPVNTIALAPDGRFFCGGLSAETLAVPGAGNLANNGCLDVILTGGNGQAIQQARNVGGAGCEKIDNFYGGSAMATDAAGNLLLAGIFENGGTFGLNNLAGNGLWVAKLNTGVVATTEPAGQNIGIRPNPAAQSVQLTFPENADGYCRVLSATGSVVSEMSVSEARALDVSGWPAGMYFLECTDRQGKKAVEKLLVQH